MNRLRGTYNATPFERLTLRPFLNPRLIRQQARLRRLKAKGLTPAGDKASLRAAATLAAQHHPIRRV